MVFSVEQRGGVIARQVDMFCLGLDMKCVSIRLHLVGIIFGGFGELGKRAWSAFGSNYIWIK